jgi:hypothetical protein
MNPNPKHQATASDRSEAKKRREGRSKRLPRGTVPKSHLGQSHAYVFMVKQSYPTHFLSCRGRMGTDQRWTSEEWRKLQTSLFSVTGNTRIKLSSLTPEQWDKVYFQITVLLTLPLPLSPSLFLPPYFSLPSCLFLPPSLPRSLSLSLPPSLLSLPSLFLFHFIVSSPGPLPSFPSLATPIQNVLQLDTITTSHHGIAKDLIRNDVNICRWSRAPAEQRLT